MEHSERSQILEQIESGQMSVEEAIGMMASQGTPAPRPADARRWLRLRVSDLETGDSKVSISIPFSWVEFGWKLGSSFAHRLQEMDLDDVTTALEQDAGGYILQVEAEDDNKRVEIFVD